MSSSEQQQAANRANALKSTGPRSSGGKAKACQNSTRHGLLSERLLLAGECHDDFSRLLADLQSALCPVGALELSVVDRIAVSLWRQRRLVTAESAAIALSRNPSKIAAAVSRELSRGYGNELSEADLQPFDQERISWCKTALGEIEGLETIDLASLPVSAPTVFEQLEADAREDEESIEQHLAGQKHGLTGYIGELLQWCKEQLAEAEARPKVQDLAQLVIARRSVVPDETLDIFGRYQSTLDNQLYKSLRALRETQEWRLKNLDAMSEPAPRPLEEAA